MAPPGSAGAVLQQDAKALAEQVRSVASERLTRKAGTVPPDLVANVDDALRTHLAA